MSHFIKTKENKKSQYKLVIMLLVLNEKPIYTVSQNHRITE